MTFRQTIVRRCVAALIACCLVATMLPVAAATAESGIPAGSGAVITAGAPLAVRTAPAGTPKFPTRSPMGPTSPSGIANRPLPTGACGTRSMAASSPSTRSPASPHSKASLRCPRTRRRMPPRVMGSSRRPRAPLVRILRLRTRRVQLRPPMIRSSRLPPIPQPIQRATRLSPIPLTRSIQRRLNRRALATADPASAAAAVDSATGEKVDPSTDQAGTPAPVDATADTPAPSTAPEPLSTATTGGTEPPGEPIATAYITNTGGDGAPCLAAPEWGTETLAVLDEGAPVEVRAETQGEWQPVNCAGAGGYVQAAQIAWTPAEPADPAATPEAGHDSGKRERKADDGGGVGERQRIVDFAMRYEGHPYVYAGEGPRAFDCSGFTMFVIQKTLGIDITHDMRCPVSRWGEPGRTECIAAWRSGLLQEHLRTRACPTPGIYIGDGQFIHAENESTGVRISDLDSDYYSPHWYGAVRYS